MMAVAIGAGADAGGNAATVRTVRGMRTVTEKTIARLVAMAVALWRTVRVTAASADNARSLAADTATITAVIAVEHS